MRFPLQRPDFTTKEPCRLEIFPFLNFLAFSLGAIDTLQLSTEKTPKAYILVVFPAWTVSVMEAAMDDCTADNVKKTEAKIANTFPGYFFISILFESKTNIYYFLLLFIIVN